MTTKPPTLALARVTFCTLLPRANHRSSRVFLYRFGTAESEIVPFLHFTRQIGDKLK